MEWNGIRANQFQAEKSVIGAWRKRVNAGVFSCGKVSCAFAEKKEIDRQKILEFLELEDQLRALCLLISCLLPFRARPESTKLAITNRAFHLRSEEHSVD